MPADPLDFLTDSSTSKSSSDPLDFLGENLSTTRSLISAPFKGILEGVQGINPLQPSGPISQELGKKISEHFLPTKPEHKPLVRAGKVASLAAIGPEGILSKLAQTVGGTALGELAESLGYGDLGQGISEAAGMGLGGLSKGLAEKGLKALTGATDKTASGLTKLRAPADKISKFAKISPQREKIIIQKLDKEASNLAKTSLEKHLPITKEIEKGINFEQNFKIGFQNLKKAAEAANPQIDVTPISELMSKTIEKYRGIPRPNPEARKVLQELKAFRSRNPTKLGSLLKIYRDNHQKIKHTYDTSLLTGKQQEYVDFLLSMNRSIRDSFEHTLPKDSAWMKQFKDLNKEYGSYQAANKTKNQLKGILSSTPKPSEIERLATDPKTQSKLAISMGKEGAEEITQIAKDLKTARDSIKNLKKSALSKYDAIFPLYFLIPYAGKFFGGYKGLELARHGYGWLLSTPSRRSAYKEALRAVVRDDLESYKKAALKLRSELKSE